MQKPQVNPEPPTETAAIAAHGGPEAGAPETGVASSSGEPQPQLLVHKSETCGCCARWVEHVQDEGYSAEVRNEEDMASVKTGLGVPDQFRSCHTAVSRHGYVFEGHVPAIAIRQFLQNPPEGALGLAVPGMPVGSPGMEVDDEFQPYQIVLMMKDGSAQAYGFVDNYASQFSPKQPKQVEPANEGP